MLGYSGFKLSILAATLGTDWAAIVATAKGSDGSWSVLGKNVKDASIRNLVQAIQDGLSGAVERKGVHGVKFAAKMQLEVVDVLEQYFASGSNRAALVVHSRHINRRLEHRTVPGRRRGLIWIYVEWMPISHLPLSSATAPLRSFFIGSPRCSWLSLTS